MTDGLVQVAADSTGKKIDTSELTVGANTVERQRVVIADSTTATSLATVKAASTAAVATDPALVVAVSPNNTVGVTQATLTKGTQGATGVSTQDLKDAGRTSVVLNAASIVSATPVALVTMQKYVAGTVTAGVTEYVVTTGKTLRVQSILITPRITTASTTVTFVTNVISLRRNTTTLATGSSLVASVSALCAANVPTPPIQMVIPDGLEFPAGDHIGFTQLASAATMTFDIVLVGFEY
jgi:hypothetical protein